MGVIVRGAQRCADGGEAVAVLRKDGVFLVQLQRLHKPLPQSHQEVQGAAQKDDLALQLPPLGQTSDGLVNHRLEDGRRHILLPAALVQDGLDVALGKYAAAAGDGVDLFVLQRQLVQLIAGHIHQCGHLVDEGAGAASAAAVHAFFQSAAEEDDLGVLAAQLNDRIGAGDEGVHCGGSGVHLLHEVDAAGLGHTQTGGAGDDHPHLMTQEFVLDALQNLAGLFTHLGKMPLIGAEQQVVLFVQYHHLDGSGTDVNTNTKVHTFSPKTVHIKNVKKFVRFFGSPSILTEFARNSKQ